MKPLSGKFVIRMPAALHHQLKEEARRSGKSLNQLCVAKLKASEQPFDGFGQAVDQAVMIPNRVTGEIVRRWHRDLVGLILFGSAARGDATDDSDIDLLLVVKPEVRIERGLYRLWDEFCRECISVPDCGRISPHFVNLPGSVREAGGLWYEVALDGIALWECDRRVSRFLASVREAIGERKILRRVLHGSPYWIKEF